MTPSRAGDTLPEPSPFLHAVQARRPDDGTWCEAWTVRDIVALVAVGAGTLGTALGPQPLAEGGLTWLPHGSSRSITAGADGLSYLTVHHRRPGMQIRTPSA
ncbi:hypothetical protein ACMATS_34480 [Streptoverticillium reticulum]|uniref:hypothetical protein n=1 Tax=Streptoverticillium reticulum TaxID=1433415 RepID=UPI0039BF88E9